MEVAMKRQDGYTLTQCIVRVLLLAGLVMTMIWAYNLIINVSTVIDTGLQPRIECYDGYKWTRTRGDIEPMVDNNGKGVQC